MRSLAETVEFTRAYLHRLYGDGVTVEYHDMALPGAEERHKALLDKAPRGVPYYPMLFVNEELRSVGSTEYYEVLAAVREVLAEVPQG